METFERNNEIEKLKWERDCHIRYIDRLVKTVKHKKTRSKDFWVKAAGKILSAGVRIKVFEIQLYKLIATPTRKFPEGGKIINGPAIVGEFGPEIVLTPSHLKP